MDLSTSGEELVEMNDGMQCEKSSARCGSRPRLSRRSREPEHTQRHDEVRAADIADEVRVCRSRSGDAGNRCIPGPGSPEHPRCVGGKKQSQRGGEPFAHDLIPQAYCFSNFAMAEVTSGESGVVAGSKRSVTLPDLSTRNFVKFHLMSPATAGFASVVSHLYSGV